MIPFLDKDNIVLGDIETIMKMKFYQLIEIQRANKTYNDLKNYQYYVDFVHGKEDEKSDSDTGLYLPNKDKEPFKWSTWEIKSAMEYDLVYVPKLGNEGWSKMMDTPGAMASRR